MDNIDKILKYIRRTNPAIWTLLLLSSCVLLSSMDTTAHVKFFV